MIDLSKKCQQLRETVLEMCIRAGTGHLTSCLSCAEIMTSIYYTSMREGDHFILSKGHASPLLYAILSDKGYIAKKELDTFGLTGSRLGVHLNNEVEGIEAISGSLGYGLGIAAGIAIAQSETRVFVLMGDAECQEGSVWESAMFVGRKRIDNIIAIIDCNGYGATLSNHPVTNWDWDDLGWFHEDVDGHDIEALSWLLKGRWSKPMLIRAHTVKGNGIPFLVDNPLWHGVAPTKPEDVDRAREAICGT